MLWDRQYLYCLIQLLITFLSMSTYTDLTVSYKECTQFATFTYIFDHDQIFFLIL